MAGHQDDDKLTSWKWNKCQLWHVPFEGVWVLLFDEGWNDSDHNGEHQNAHYFNAQLGFLLFPGHEESKVSGHLDRVRFLAVLAWVGDRIAISLCIGVFGWAECFIEAFTMYVLELVFAHAHPDQRAGIVTTLTDSAYHVNWWWCCWSFLIWFEWWVKTHVAMM